MRIAAKTTCEINAAMLMDWSEFGSKTIHNANLKAHKSAKLSDPKNPRKAYLEDDARERGEGR
jgi:hypothetical protein